ncbi:MAG: RNA recognition motif domain-containing protein [Pyrinomonadaceae bacterium]
MSTKLYVGNLSFGVTSEDLQEHFAQAGTVESAKIVEDRDTGRSRGFGFVEMSSAEEAQAAIEQFNNQDFDGRNLVVNEARPREEGGGGGRGGNRGGGGRGGYGGGGGRGGNRGGGGGNYSRW